MKGYEFLPNCLPVKDGRNQKYSMQYSPVVHNYKCVSIVWKTTYIFAILSNWLENPTMDANIMRKFIWILRYHLLLSACIKYSLPITQRFMKHLNFLFFFTLFSIFLSFVLHFFRFFYQSSVSIAWCLRLDHICFTIPYISNGMQLEWWLWPAGVPPLSCWFCCYCYHCEIPLWLHIHICHMHSPESSTGFFWKMFCDQFQFIEFFLESGIIQILFDLSVNNTGQASISDHTMQRTNFTVYPSMYLI